ncbi:hypothetical protein EC973_008619 [Apophysomyces ossiformis]|uniref:F-box domain-containing protein n=1 Tax=Apophysomyces ossiformis TaxID=679940 RepID=A0A8H7EP00_9FUNG|nr:hypothetical protein EC973_008619 [Apophysomyces ossiformis]
MLLFHLPAELLSSLLYLLPRQSLANLCLTCRLAYELCLPTLYSHLALSRRAHVRQLEHGADTRSVLRETMATSVRTLSLISGQNGHWLVSDLHSLLRKLPNVHTLTLIGFNGLPVHQLCRLAPLFPELNKLTVKYCQLQAVDEQQEESARFNNLTSVSFVWTDFSKEAIRQLLVSLPCLKQIDFGANHNRILGANDSALEALRDHCSYINHLSVSLQEVNETSLCSVIAHYGSQLKRLSIRCASADTLKTVATHATCIEQLVIRSSGDVALQTRRQRQNRAQHESEEETEEEAVEDNVMGILQHCRGLVRLEMVSWMIQDVPWIVWRAMDTVSQRRRTTAVTKQVQPSHACKSHPISTKPTSKETMLMVAAAFREHNGRAPAPRAAFEMARHERENPRRTHKETVALDTEELQEIRKSFPVSAD